MSLWLTPSPHHLPEPHGERQGGDKGHGGTCWERHSLANPPLRRTPWPHPQRAQGHRPEELLVSKSFLLLYFVFPSFPAFFRRAQMPLLWLGSLGQQPAEAPETPCVSA